jgi:hypothetical protein
MLGGSKFDSDRRTLVHFQTQQSQSAILKTKDPSEYQLLRTLVLFEFQFNLNQLISMGIWEFLMRAVSFLLALWQ